jgi:acetolactate synthase-1/3 small subunit
MTIPIEQDMRHIISILLENEAGALSRVAGLFSARGYNIESLNVAPTEDPSLSRMTLVTRGSNDIVEQITKQLNKLVDVVKLVDLSSEGAHIERELMMVKLRADGNARDEVIRLVGIFRAQVVDVSSTSMVVAINGDSKKLDALLAAMPRGWIVEVVRSGVCGMGRGDKGLSI